MDVVKEKNTIVLLYLFQNREYSFLKLPAELGSCYGTGKAQFVDLPALKLCRNIPGIYPPYELLHQGSFAYPLLPYY